MTENPYTKYVTHRFTVDDVLLEIVDVYGTPLGAIIEETRKNGQEDCHMSGNAKRGDEGNWIWKKDDGDDDENFSTYESPEFAANILNFLDQHDLPTDWS